MCLECHRRAVNHLIAMIEAGKNVPVVPATHFNAEQAEQDAKSMPLMGGRIAELLRLTMLNGEGADGELEFQVTPEAAEPLVSYISLLPTLDLYALGLMLGMARRQFDIAEDVALDAMKARAAEGDIDALASIVPRFGSGVMVVGLGNIGRPPRRRTAQPD